MNEPPKPRWGYLRWGIVLVVVLLGWLFMAALFPKMADEGVHMRGVSHCRQIILSLKMFSKDNCSAYPDSGPAGTGAVSANQVFHRLFEEEILTDERIFGCPNSVFVPDGDIGMKPDFDKAVAPGECHWILLKFQTDASIGALPIVVENALVTSWPLKWDVSDQAGSKRGRAGLKRSIIVGRNDGSVAVEKLNFDGTINWKARPGNASWIEKFKPEDLASLSYWDIEEK